MDMAIKCANCDKVMDNLGKHLCYGKLVTEIHEDNGKPVCHDCYDKAVNDAVTNLGW